MKILTFTLWLAIFGLFSLSPPTEAEPAAQAIPAQALRQPADIEAFVREGCPHCGKAGEFLEKLRREQPSLRVVIHDVSQDPAALERLKQIAGQLNVKAARVPAFAVGGQLILGFTDESISGPLIREALAQTGKVAVPAANDEAASCEAEASLSCGPGSPPSAVPRLPESFAIDWDTR